MVKVFCPKCKENVGQVEASKIPQQGAKTTCPKCSIKILLFKNAAKPTSVVKETPLEALSSSLIINQTSTDSTIPDTLLKHSLVVKKVSPNGPAALLGIEEGDLFYKINDINAADVEFCNAPYNEQKTYKVVVYLKQQGKRIYFESKTMHLGIELEKTNEAIEADFIKGSGIVDELILVWRNCNWKLLNKLADLYASNEKKVSLARSKKKASQNTPAVLFKGVALYEMNKKNKGIKLIKKYIDRFSHLWDMNFMAIATYYDALDTLEKGNEGVAVHLLHTAFSHYPHKQITDKIASLEHTLPQKTQVWQTKEFPVKYLLETINENPEKVSLEETLELLKPCQVLVLCVLPESRGNKKYNDFMNMYIKYAHHMKEVIYGVHVIAGKNEKRIDRPYWYEAEDKVVSNDTMHISILYDANQEIIDTLHATECPHILLLNHFGKVLHEGWFNDVDIWDICKDATKETNPH